MLSPTKAICVEIRRVREGLIRRQFRHANELEWQNAKAPAFMPLKTIRRSLAITQSNCGNSGVCPSEVGIVQLSSAGGARLK